jgi:hypothetical protein
MGPKQIIQGALKSAELKLLYFSIHRLTQLGINFEQAISFPLSLYSMALRLPRPFGEKIGQLRPSYFLGG